MTTIKDNFWHFVGHDNVRLLNGKWMITVSHCVHCNRLCIAPINDMCVCGAEMHPVEKWVQLGVPTLVDMKGG
jgi:hypothetical protein